MMLMGVRAHDSEIRSDDVGHRRERRHLNSVQAAGPTDGERSKIRMKGIITCGSA